MSVRILDGCNVAVVIYIRTRQRPKASHNRRDVTASAKASGAPRVLREREANNPLSPGGARNMAANTCARTSSGRSVRVKDLEEDKFVVSFVVGNGDMVIIRSVR